MGVLGFQTTETNSTTASRKIQQKPVMLGKSAFQMGAEALLTLVKPELSYQDSTT